jgi:hypothetical protein
LVTTAAKSAAPLRVPAGGRNISPRNLSEDFLDLGSANHVISAPAMPLAFAVIHPDTGKSMEYWDVMKIPTLKPLWERGLGDECQLFFQGLRDIKGTNTCFFVELKNIPKDCKITFMNGLQIGNGGNIESPWSGGTWRRELSISLHSRIM